MIRQLYRLLALGLTVLVFGMGMVQADQRRGRFVHEDDPPHQEMIDRLMEQRRERLRALREDMERQMQPRPGLAPHLLPPVRDPRGNNAERVRGMPPEPPINPRRLSPEERRQLRRDVRDADDEIYRR